MSRVEDRGELDGWRCWLCDEPVDRTMSVNDPRGPSIDAFAVKASGKGKTSLGSSERLAHRACNTKKGAIAPVVRWPSHLFVGDPAPIIASVERLGRKGGREVMARCPTLADGNDAAAWLSDRVSRLCPDLSLTATVEAGGGTFLLVLKA